MQGRTKTAAARGLYAAAVLCFFLGLLPQSTGLGGVLVKLLWCLFGAAAVAAGGVLRFRAHPEQKRRIVRQSVWALFIVYMVMLMFLLLFNNRAIDFSMQTNWRSANWIPFTTIRFYISRLPSGVAIVNLAGNLAAFMPCGLFLPLLFRRLDRFGWFLLATALGVAAVEFIQLATALGACDVDDFILNVTGAALAYGLFRLPPLKRLLTRFGLRHTAGL